MSQQSFKFIADEKWMVLLRASLRNNLIKEIGSAAFSIYVIIRSEADINTGGATLSYRTIGKLTGFSPPTIAKAIKKLKDGNFIEVVDVGVNLKRYFCTDTIPFAKVEDHQNPYEVRQQLEDGTIKPTGMATIKYVPSQVFDNRKEMHEFLTNGTVPANSNIKIEHFHLHLNFSDQMKDLVLDVEEEEVREMLLRIAKKHPGRKDVLMEGVQVSASVKPDGKGKV